MQIKAADDRQQDISTLDRLLERSDLRPDTRDRIAAELRQIKAGAKGEHDAAYDIEFHFGRSRNWATIHDLRIEVDGLSAQIDHLIINRLAEIWVCESKHFAEGVSVNEHGEWVRWWHGRPEGMASPIEQNRRHVHLLERVFDDGVIKAPKRLGLFPLKPRIRSLVLVSDGARIGRPRRAIDGLDQVIKAEQVRTKLFDEYDRMSTARVATLIGKEGLEAFAIALAALHRPATVNWAARFGLPSEPPVIPAQVRSALRDEVDGPSRQRAGAGVCARCDRQVSAAVLRYCSEHAVEFGGAVYCMRCQPEVRAMMERPVNVPAWATVLERYRTPTRLRTVARQAPFIVVASGDNLRVTPDSSDRARSLTQADFERAAPLLGRHGRGEVNEASRNSSYVEAILADVARGDRAH